MKKKIIKEQLLDKTKEEKNVSVVKEATKVAPSEEAKLQTETKSSAGTVSKIYFQDQKFPDKTELLVEITKKDKKATQKTGVQKEFDKTQKADFSDEKLVITPKKTSIAKKVSFDIAENEVNLEKAGKLENVTNVSTKIDDSIEKLFTPKERTEKKLNEQEKVVKQESEKAEKQSNKIIETSTHEKEPAKQRKRVAMITTKVAVKEIQESANPVIHEFKSLQDHTIDKQLETRTSTDQHKTTETKIKKEHAKSPDVKKQKRSRAETQAVDTKITEKKKKETHVRASKNATLVSFEDEVSETKTAATKTSVDDARAGKVSQTEKIGEKQVIDTTKAAKTEKDPKVIKNKQQISQGGPNILLADKVPANAESKIIHKRSSAIKLVTEKLESVNAKKKTVQTTEKMPVDNELKEKEQLLKAKEEIDKKVRQIKSDDVKVKRETDSRQNNKEATAAALSTHIKTVEETKAIQKFLDKSTEIKSDTIKTVEKAPKTRASNEEPSLKKETESQLEIKKQTSKTALLDSLDDKINQSIKKVSNKLLFSSDTDEPAVITKVTSTAVDSSVKSKGLELQKKTFHWSTFPETPTNAVTDSLQPKNVVKETQQGETTSMQIKEEKSVQSLPASIGRSRMKITETVKDARKPDYVAVEAEPRISISESVQFQTMISREEVIDGKRIDEKFTFSKPKCEFIKKSVHLHQAFIQIMGIFLLCFYLIIIVIVITFYSTSCLGQETAKGHFGLRVKLPPAHLSSTHGGGFILSHSLLNVKQGSLEYQFS